MTDDEQALVALIDRMEAAAAKAKKNTAETHEKLSAGVEELILQRDELLAALQAMHKICRDCDLEIHERPSEDEYCAAMDAAETAISKATGETP